MTEPMTAEELARGVGVSPTATGWYRFVPSQLEALIAAARASAPPAGVDEAYLAGKRDGEAVGEYQRMEAVGRAVQLAYDAPPSDPAGREEIARLRERLLKKAVYTDEFYNNHTLGELFREAAAVLQRGTEGAGS